MAFGFVFGFAFFLAAVFVFFTDFALDGALEAFFFVDFLAAFFAAFAFLGEDFFAVASPFLEDVDEDFFFAAFFLNAADHPSEYFVLEPTRRIDMIILKTP